MKPSLSVVKVPRSNAAAASSCAEDSGLVDSAPRKEAVPTNLVQAPLSTSNLFIDFPFGDAHSSAAAVPIVNVISLRGRECVALRKGALQFFFGRR